MSYAIEERESRTINGLKTIFTFLVILIHARAYTGKGYLDYGVGGVQGNLTIVTPDWLWNLEFIISGIIAHVAVPGFFLISAILLYRKDFKFFENIKKKFRSICIPWFIIITFWIAVYAVVQRIPQIAPYFSNEDKIIANWNWFNYIDAYLGITGSPLVYPLWYLQNLIVLNIIAVPIKKLIDRFPRIVFAILLVLYFSPFEHLLFCMEKVSLFWFCMGCYVVKSDIHIKDIERVKIVPLSICYAISVTLSFVFREQWFDYIFDELNIISGILVFAYIFWKKNGNETKDGEKIKSLHLQLLAKYSFFVYIMHEMNLRIILKAYTKIIGSSLIAQIIEYFIIPAALILCLTILGWLLERYLKPVYKVLNGGR